MAETIRVPITAKYQIIDGKAVQVDAEYADVPVDVIAKLLLKGFGVSTEHGVDE